MSAEAAEKKVVELKAPDAEAGKPAAPPAPARSGRRRYAVMAAVPIVLLAVGGWLWLTGGRYASTDNAYVKQDKVTIAADVSGRIVEVDARENDAVAAGQLLFRIDPAPYRIALEGAEAALATARLQVDQLRAAHEQALAEEKAASDDVAFKKKLYDRQQDLLKKGVSPQSTFDSAENDLHAAEQALSQASQRASSALAALGGDAAIATDDHPTVKAAIAKRDQAALDLANTEVHAPAPGVVAQADKLQVGQYVTATSAVMAIVRTGDVWVEANFKETDLTRMTVGEPATITVDAYPGRSFAGEVASIGAGTGSEFSLLPAQNATGNWVKVVQRVPVRIRFVEPPADLPLRTGLSASVAVDLKAGGASAAAAENGK